MSNANYKSLASSVAFLDRMLESFRALHRDKLGPVITAEQMSRAVAIRESGCRTVAITFAFFQVVDHLPKISDAAKRKAQAKSVFQQVSAKMTLPKCVEQRFQQLMEGEADIKVEQSTG